MFSSFRAFLIDLFGSGLSGLGYIESRLRKVAIDFKKDKSTEIEENKIVGTSFISDVMPLIRYEVNDSMQLRSETPIGDKVLYPVVENISGRMEDITYTAEGKSVPPALVTFPFKNLKLIESCKIIQNNKTDFDVIIQSSRTKEELQVEINELEEKMKIIYGESATFNFSITTKIPLTKNGKFKWVECKYQQEK